MEFSSSRRKALSVALLGAGIASASGAAEAVTSASRKGRSAALTKVVFQVSDADPAKWNLALNNARNVQDELGKDKVAIEIVAYGPGIGMLKAESKVADRLALALDNSVGLMACENTMHNTRLKKEDMYEGISYVPAGVVHIMKRQSEGWAYVRP